MSDPARGGNWPRTAVSEADAEALVHGVCFKTGPPERLGVEVEWLIHEPRAPRLPVPPERLRAMYTALRGMPLRSALTVEPGGRLELSSPPATSLMECVRTVSADLDAIRTVLREDGLALLGIGHDPWHAPRRFLRQPRYDAMEACLSYATGESPLGLRQLIGDVWEWTAGDFLPYPGFEAFPYKEYSEVFFGPDHKVLRGGSFAVDQVACRGTFRNWDYPIRRQIFSGFRTARSAEGT